MNRKILYRFFEGEASRDEKEAVKTWLEASPDHKEEFFRERKFYDAVILSKYNMPGTSRNQFRPRKRFKKVFAEFTKVAAIFLLVLSAGIYIYQQQIDKILQTTNTIMVPPGQRANIQLPDGSDVWLNGGSEISYPVYFTDKNRDVYLKGQAFFDVSPDKKMPFIVHTRNYEIEVLGTSFDVEAYPDSPDFTTALMTGSVKISRTDNPAENITLLSNQRVMTVDGRLVKETIYDFDIYRWKEGLICFKDIEFGELMKRFEKCYDVEIRIENPRIARKIFGGKFRISDGIENALRILQKEGEYAFERLDENPVVYIIK